MAREEGELVGFSGGVERHPRHGLDAHQPEEQQAVGSSSNHIRFYSFTHVYLLDSVRGRLTKICARAAVYGQPLVVRGWRQRRVEAAAA